MSTSAMRAVNNGVAQDKLTGEGLLKLKLTAVEHENQAADGLWIISVTGIRTLERDGTI